jgi:hypothetical protein
MVRWTLAIVIAGLALAATSTASAAPAGFSVQDRAGDAPHPQLDLRAAALVLDPAAGGLSGSVTVAEAPTYENAESLQIALGRAHKRTGVCRMSRYVIVAIPDLEEQDAGYAFPFAELYPEKGDPFGFLPAYSENGSSPRIEFGSAEATDEPLLAEIPRLRVNCADVTSYGPTSDYADDAIDDLPLLAGPTPSCTFSRNSPPRRLRVSCKDLGGKVVARIYRGERLARTQSLRIRRGRVTVPTGNVTGRLRVTLWQGGTIAAALYLRAG